MRIFDEIIKTKAAKENVIGANQPSLVSTLLDKNKASEVGTRCGTPDESHTSEGFRNTLIQRELAHLGRDAKAEFNIADECFFQPLFLQGHGSMV